MTCFRSNLFLILEAALLWTLILAVPWPALAQGLEVEFQTSPLFENSHLLPGDQITREVKVRNTGTEEQQIQTEAINEAACSGDLCLAEILELKISSDQGWFNGSLAEFYAAGEVNLGAVAAGQSRVFDYEVSFPDQAPDGYQKQSTGFDLLVGFQGGESATDQPSDPSNRGSITSGGLAGLLISDESDRLLDRESGSVEISWHTNHPATSQVIYGSYERGPYQVDLEEPHFGYPSATLKNTTKTREHTVPLSDLAPGRYRYRVVSHASPASISREHIFTVPEADGETVSGPVVRPKLALAEQSDLKRFSAHSAETGGSRLTDETGGPTGPAEDPDQETIATDDPSPDRGRLAAVATAAGWLEPLLWAATLLLLLVLILRFWRRKQK